MKKLVILLMFVVTSCVPLQNICDDGIERLNGEVVYAIPCGSYYRTVILEINGKLVVIYRVPKEQLLSNIPVCKHNNKYYWVMP